MKINSIDDFVKYIRLRLGEPVVKVELSDEQIKIIIEDEISHFQPSLKWGETQPLLSTKDTCVVKCYDLWKKILNKYPGVRKNLGITPDNEDSCDAYVLSKEHPNVFFIDCGYMPRTKAEEYVANVMKQVREVAGEEYKIIFFPRFKRN